MPCGSQVKQAKPLSRETLLQTRRTILAGLALAATGQFSTAARAATYPDQPVRFIVGAPPGGSNDIVARLLAERLTTLLGSPFLVDNRPGDSGARGAEFVTRQPADGYTMLMANVATHAINQVLIPSSTFDPKRDSIPVVAIGTIPNILVVNPKLPVHSVAELIAYAKAHPGKLNFASAGTGGSVHLAGELFKLLAGVDIVHVPYRGSGPMVTDLIAGNVDLAFDNFPSSIGAARAGSLRALAVTSAKRWPLAMDLPTMVESGLPDFVITTWVGITMRSGTPPAIVATLHDTVDKILNEPGMVQHLAALGAQPLHMSSEEFGKFIDSEQVFWRDLVLRAHVKLD
jgi:tripartite-type tricarboxylate transporter receptor subunit TctC